MTQCTCRVITDSYKERPVCAVASVDACSIFTVFLLIVYLPLLKGLPYVQRPCYHYLLQIGANC
jgi:hypothetical protein